MTDEKTFRFNISDLEIRTVDFIKLLGYSENTFPDHVKGILSEILEEAPSHLDIRGGYIVKEIISLDIPEGSIQLDETSFKTGRTICENLKDSEKIICFLCTAGEGISKWTSETLQTDPLKFYMIDILGSLTVDSATETFLSRLELELESEGQKITNNYSPGYCGWKLVEQKKMFSLFPKGFCNISLNDSSLMMPIKSISGIAGIGKNVEKRAYSCEICDAQDCIYRDLRK